MAPPHHPAIPLAAQPRHSAHFDAWNSSSTGHQRAENRLSGSTGWRQSRSMKLAHQYRSGGTGGKRLADLVGAGADAWDDKAKALIPQAVRERARCSVADMLVAAVGSKSIKNAGQIGPAGPVRQKTMANYGPSSSGAHATYTSAEDERTAVRRAEDEAAERQREESRRRKGIFDGLTIYVNGSTAPLVSDHKLKQLLAENGARVAIALGRRSVTHVVLGTPCAGQGATTIGAGGGLAGGKLQKEIARIGGCGVKYVGVEWVLESVKAGKRLAEAPFVNLQVAPRNQQSVYGMFSKAAA